MMSKALEKFKSLDNQLTTLLKKGEDLTEDEQTSFDQLRNDMIKLAEDNDFIWFSVQTKITAAQPPPLPQQADFKLDGNYGVISKGIWTSAYISGYIWTQNAIITGKDGKITGFLLQGPLGTELVQDHETTEFKGYYTGKIPQEWYQ